MYRGIPEVAPPGWYRPPETSILSRLYPSLFTPVKSAEARARRLSKLEGNWVIVRPNKLRSAVRPLPSEAGYIFRLPLTDIAAGRQVRFGNWIVIFE